MAVDSVFSDAAESARPGLQGEPARARRRPAFRFDVEALRATRNHPYVQLMAVGSVFSPAAESFMVDTLRAMQAASGDDDPVAGVDGFIVQESNHMDAHEELNRILIEEVYPDRKMLKRVRRLFDAYYGLSPPVRLAVAAGYEYAADCIFKAYIDNYYAAGGVLDDDPEIDRLLRSTGLFDLYLWHASEEFGHRDVVFDLLDAAEVPYRVRVLGLMLVVVATIRYQQPSLMELIAAEKSSLPRFLRYAFVRPGAVSGYFCSLRKYFERGFHPSQLDASHAEAQLRHDLDKLLGRLGERPAEDAP
jgi:predicted metal-dependent hydrolase